MNNLAGNSATSNRPRGDKKPWTGKLVLGIVGLFAVVFVIYISTSIFGRVAGEEFAPGTLQRRTFTYLELPLIRVQVSPISRETTTNSLEQYLRRKKLFSGPKQGVGAPTRWDLVYSDQAHQGRIYGDAGILCAYLDAEDSQSNHIWETWTEKNPDMGKILWATVGRLADQRLYLFVPDVFELAVETENATEFEQRLNQTLADRYKSLARTQQELGNWETSRELKKEGLSYELAIPTSQQTPTEQTDLEVD